LQTKRNTQQNYVEPQNAFNFLSNVSYSEKKNNNNWTFLISNGNLIISNPTHTISREFPFAHIVYNETGIFDKNANIPLPLTDNQKSKSLVRFPYVIEVDKYLPIMRIYDQNKTLLQQYSVLDPAIGLSLDTITCPEFTYYSKGSCIRLCPLGYYQYKNGTRGVCTLSPFPDGLIDRGSSVNNASNPTYNYSIGFDGCPYLSTNYSYGCYCLQGKNFEFDKWNCSLSK
jgi:hypothetical protein